MLLFLIEWLAHSFAIKVPAVFEYYSTRMALSALTALLFTIFCGKGFIRKLYEWKIGDRVRKEHCPLLFELHEKKSETPTMGGILILSALVLSLLLWMDLRSSFTLLLLATTLILGATGACDDYLKLTKKNTKGLAPKAKFIIQTLFASFVALYLLYPPLSEALHTGTFFSPPYAKEVSLSKNEPLSSKGELTTREYASRLYIPFCKKPFLITSWAIFALFLLIVCVISGSSNAVNLTDGLDGLATGTVMLASCSFAIIAFVSNNLDLASYLNILYIEGSGEIAIYLAAVAGATLGFLWYNGYPAQVFMGDTGSLALGGILGVSAVLLKREMLLAIIGAVFVAEALSVILQVGSYKLRGKKRIFLCTPLHHHFEYKGWSESKVVLRFWIVGLLVAIVGVASLKFQ